jgi:hypothetical protein
MLPKTTNNNDIHAPLKQLSLPLLFVVLGEHDYQYYFLLLGSMIIIIICCFRGA